MNIKRCDNCGRLLAKEAEFNAVNLLHFIPNDIGEEACSGYSEKTELVELCHCCYCDYRDRINKLYEAMTHKLVENKLILKNIQQGEI